jgi:DNA mismatch endonuclease (patch repair protein)
MAAIRSRGNKSTEIKLASILRANGIKGWRRHLALPGKPDFAFCRERLAVFVDGCFWHGCAFHCRRPSSNRSYWVPKIFRNQKRDAAVTKRLRETGWRVLRIWEHELRYPGRAARRIAWALQKQNQKMTERRDLH